MEREAGLKQIDEAEWVEDEFGILNMHVTMNLPGKGEWDVLAFLSLRPTYCDRGHIQLNIEGPLNLDHSDSFPRFFFTFEEADHHTRTFLKWRLWKHRTYPHQLRDPRDPSMDLSPADMIARLLTEEK